MSGLARYWRETEPLRRAVYGGSPELQAKVRDEFGEDRLYLAFTGSCRDDPLDCPRCDLRMLIENHIERVR